MKTPVRITAGIFLGTVVFFAGYMANRQKVTAVSFASVEEAARYACPMHPQYSSSENVSRYPIPSSAVIDSGRRKTIYVERAAGRFEPRIVETGWHPGNRLPITRGLDPGERIVVSGNFPSDSESRMKPAESSNPSAAEKTAVAKDLVCGMTVDPKSPGTLKTQYKGETYYFCSDTCKKSFEANPEKYIPKKSAPAKAENTKDLVCGMTVDPNSPKTLKTQYKGRTYYFCSELCKKTFEANPAKYAPKMADEGMHGIHKPI